MVVGALREINTPLRHGLVQRSDFPTHRALGVALLASLAEIIATFILAALLGGVYGGKQFENHDDDYPNKTCLEQAMHDGPPIL